MPNFSHPLPTTQPTLHSSPCIVGACLEDRDAIRYQCFLPCFNTEQMNGLHAISLKEENSKAGGGEWCNGWVGGVFYKVPSNHGQRSIIHTADNSCDRGFLSLSSVKTLGRVSISHDGIRIRLHRREACWVKDGTTLLSSLWILTETTSRGLQEADTEHRAWHSALTGSLMTLSLNHNTIQVQRGRAYTHRG